MGLMNDAITTQRIAGLFVAASLLGTGCEPSCEATCKTLLACDSVETSRVHIDECTSTCQIQEQLYESWEDQQLRDAFGELKTCIQSVECSDLADGACYDEELYIW